MQMNRLGTGLLILLAVGVGGGSLMAFAYFLIAGAPLPIRLAQSDGARLALDAVLCLVFFLQHSGMVRRGAKQWITQWVDAIYLPAVYAIASGLALLVLVLLWQPTGDVLYCLYGPARWLLAGLAGAAIAGLAWGVYSLPGFDPLGTRPLISELRRASPPPSEFAVRGPYRFVRHPLYLFALVLIWAAPCPSTDRFLFNVLWTIWIIVGTRLEERDLVRDFGQTYREYQQAVPMLVPTPRFLWRRKQPGPSGRENR